MQKYVFKLSKLKEEKLLPSEAFDQETLNIANTSR